MTNGNPLAVVCNTLDEVREVAARAVELAPHVRAVLAPFIPSGAVSLFSGVGIAALRFDAAGGKGLKGQKTVALPPPAQWAENEPTVVAAGSQKVSLTWLALGPERAWVSAGTSRPAPVAPRSRG
jgi:aconitate hydratase